MRKFILVDHSLKSAGGHHCDYALQVLRAAHTRGFTTLLAAHRSFQRIDELPRDCKVYSVFPNTMYSPFTVFIASSRHLLAKTNDARRAVMAKRLWRIARRAADATMDSLKSFFAPDAHQRVRQFTNACKRLFKQIELQQGDVIFLASLSDLDLLGLARFLTATPTTQIADWHLQFHFSIFEGREPDYAGQSDRLRLVRQRFAETLDMLPNHRLHFYNTSEALAEQYNRLGLAKFRPLPYPINPAFLCGADRDREAGPLRITCAGGLRPEKGQQHLPQVLRDMWQDEFAAGRAQLWVQSKWSRWSDKPRLQLPLPEGAANTSCADMPIRYVRHPLSSDAYTQLIRQTDIGLLMYDSRRYYARRAGVLCELLTAGVPVVVSAGGWLADQIAEPIACHLQRLSEQLPTVDQHEFRDVAVDEYPRMAGNLHPIPTGATELLVNVHGDESFSRGVYLHVEVEELGKSGDLVSRFAHVVGPRSKKRPSLALFHLDSRTRYVRVSFRNAYHDELTRLTSVRLSFHSTATPGESPPAGQVGLIAADPQHISRLLREMIRHYNHYRTTAAEFSIKWFRQHDPLRTIQELVRHSSPAIPIARNEVWVPLQRA